MHSRTADFVNSPSLEFCHSRLYQEMEGLCVRVGRNAGLVIPPLLEICSPRPYKEEDGGTQVDSSRYWSLKMWRVPVVLNRAWPDCPARVSSNPNGVSACFQVYNGAV